jgi:sugar phosphate isomerase/epimerase
MGYTRGFGWEGLCMMALGRRELVKGCGLLGLQCVLPSGRGGANAFALPVSKESGGCPFRLAVINDEITQDFERACTIASQEFGLSWIELRSMWESNVTTLSDREIEEARKILAAHKLRVTDIASPMFKTAWPGAPLSKLAEHGDQFHADFDMSAQDQLLDRCIALAKTFETDRIRCFDFWRLDDPKPYRSVINAKLRQAAERCASNGLILLLENEMTCNTATGEEAAAILQAIPNKNFMLNWDPGNAAAAGSNAYPSGYDLLPKERIGHCHCKDVVTKAGGGYDWAPVGGGTVDWVDQLRAMQRDGFRYALSLETHWKGGGSPEAPTRISMDGLKKTLAKTGLAC